MAAPLSPALDLYDRLVDVLGSYDIHPDDRAIVQAAFFDGATWDDLPRNVQQIILEAEASARQSWTDPMDVPDVLTD